MYTQRTYIHIHRTEYMKLNTRQNKQTFHAIGLAKKTKVSHTQYTCFNVRLERRKKQARSNKQQAKQHSTPKAVTFPKKNELPRYMVTMFIRPSQLCAVHLLVFLSELAVSHNNYMQCTCNITANVQYNYDTQTINTCPDYGFQRMLCKFQWIEDASSMTQPLSLSS